MTDGIPALNDLSAIERQLVEHARGGIPLVCGTVPTDELFTTADPAHRIRAKLIRELLLGRHGPLDPRGVSVRGARIVGPLHLEQLATATRLTLVDCAIPETVFALQAKLGGLVLNGSRLSSLLADGLRVEGAVRMERVRIDSSEPSGALRLIGSRIGGLILGEAVVRSEQGVALNLESAKVAGPVFLNEATLSANTPHSALHLLEAEISGSLVCTAMEVGNPIGSTVNLRSARVDRTARLSTALVCPDPRPHGSGCPHPGRVTLDGFTFGELQTEGWSQWLHLIRFHTNHYHPQPYQQLAAAERGSGHDANARHVLIAQQHDLRRLQPRAIGGRPARFAHWLWGVLGGYGYRALRLAVALAIALALSGGLGVWAGHVTTRPGHHVAERTAASGSPPGTPCTTVELVGLGLDRGLPLGVTGLRARCDLDTGTDKGQAFTVAVWGVQIAVWILATLAIAGYTGLIRKSS